MSVSKSASTQPLKVALLGYGFVGKTFHAPLINSVEGLELQIVASSNSEKVHVDLPTVQVFANAEEAATHPDIDLVVIATPNATHAPLATLALQAGKHVVVDKPFTLTMEEARTLIDLAEEKQRVLSVFHNRRWDSDFLSIKQLIDDKKIGRIVQFESHIDRFRPTVRERWREQALPGSGLWFDIGPHIVDQALQLFGLPDSVQGNIATLREGAKTNDWAHVVLNYPQLKVILHSSMLSAGGSLRFVVHGTQGSLVKPLADQQEQQLIEGIRPGSDAWGQDADQVIYYDNQEQAHHLNSPRGDQSQYYQHLRDALWDKAENPVTPLQALAVMAVLEAAVSSSQSGEVVQLALTPAELAAWQ